MTLTITDLKSIRKLFDKSIDQKLDKKLDNQSTLIDKKFDKQNNLIDKKFHKQDIQIDKKLSKQRSEIVNDILKYLDNNFATKQELNELKKKIDHLPTKDEFFKKMDEIIGEYKTFEQERDTILHQLRRINATLDLSQ